MVINTSWKLHRLASPLRLTATLHHKNVIDYCESPRNVGTLDKNDNNVGTGLVRHPIYGDVVKFQIKVNKNGKIIDAKFKTSGTSNRFAMASCSAAAEMIKGRTVNEARKLKNTDIQKLLKLIPQEKMHYLMLAENAVKAALLDYKNKQQESIILI